MEYFFILFVVISVITLSGIKVAAEHERFAVIKLGKFDKLKGPGIQIKIIWDRSKWIRLRIGDRGELVAAELARFQNKNFPVLIDAGSKIGSSIKITGFYENKIEVQIDAD